MGNVHAKHFREMPGVEIGYRDQSPERSGSFRERWGARSFDSAEALIAWADVVDICLPTDLHTEYALRAIASGKAVFLEKPISLTIEDGVRTIEAAAKAGVPLAVGMVVRYFPEYALGNRLVRQGVVGRPAAVRTHRGGPAPKGAGGWFMDHGRSGGILIDQAIHDFDWLRWTLGEVSFLYSRSLGATSGHGPDYALTTLTFECGAVAHVESTWMDPSGFRTSYEIAGSEGLIEFDTRTAAALRTYVPGESKYETALASSDDPYYAELSAFLSAVKSGNSPPVTGEDGLIALALALAARESTASGQVVRPTRL